MTSLVELKDTATMVCFSQEEQEQYQEMIKMLAEEKTKIEQEITCLKEKGETLWEIEAEAKEFLGKKIVQLANKKNQKESEIAMQYKEIERKSCKFSSKYHKISWEPFGKRTPNGFPVFCIWNVFTGKTLYTGAHSAISKSTIVAIKLQTHDGRYYYDTGTNWTKNSAFLSLGFNGIIPEEVKKSIKKAEIDFGKQMFLVQETKEENIKISKDPLIVGLCEHNDLWLIDSFDETPLEEALFFTQP